MLDVRFWVLGFGIFDFDFEYLYISSIQDPGSRAGRGGQGSPRRAGEPIMRGGPPFQKKSEKGGVSNFPVGNQPGSYLCI